MEVNRLGMDKTNLAAESQSCPLGYTAEPGVADQDTEKTVAPKLSIYLKSQTK